MKAIEIVDLSFRRDPRGVEVLSNVSLDLDHGEIVAILGPNGAGKSTLVLCLLGLQPRQRGSIRLNGEDIGGLSRAEMAKRIAYVPQSTQSAFAFDVTQMVLMGRSAHVEGMGSPSRHDRRFAEMSMEQVGVWPLRDRLFTELSGGERQLVLIARALAQDAPIIVMDEPTASLDLGNQGRVLTLVRDLARLGKSVVMTTHLPDQAFNLRCKVALMNAGRITGVGPVAEICSAESMTALYGAPLHGLTGGADNELTAFAPRLD
jgi:iron complex transport system ATP-binding protein